jgi:hypothetical protein
MQRQGLGSASPSAHASPPAGASTFSPISELMSVINAEARALP